MKTPCRSNACPIRGLERGLFRHTALFCHFWAERVGIGDHGRCARGTQDQRRVVLRAADWREGGEADVEDVATCEAAGREPHAELEMKKTEEKKFSPEVFLHELLLLETGTAVTLFAETDLFFAEAVLAVLAVLSTRGEIDVGRVRRVLILPSGWLLLLRELDVNLFVSLNGGLRLAVPISRGEDAERDGDAGFKVQIGDFCWRERIGFSYNPP